jgi:hypothetical protein
MREFYINNEETALALLTPEPNVDTRPLSWSEHRYIEFSRSTTSIPIYPVGLTEVEADSARWLADAERAAARLHREDLHLARVNSALFQISNDVLSSSMVDVHLRAETVLRSEERPPKKPAHSEVCHERFDRAQAFRNLKIEQAATLS